MPEDTRGNILKITKESNRYYLKQDKPPAP